jgi:hypothetical protein
MGRSLPATVAGRAAGGPVRWVLRPFRSRPPCVHPQHSPWGRGDESGNDRSARRGKIDSTQGTLPRCLLTKVSKRVRTQRCQSSDWICKRTVRSLGTRPGGVSATRKPGRSAELSFLRRFRFPRRFRLVARPSFPRRSASTDNVGFRICVPGRTLRNFDPGTRTRRTLSKFRMVNR